MRFIVFERSDGHCHITMLQGATLTAALGAYLTRKWCCVADERGWVMDSGSMVHPLQIIERDCKANREFDELEVGTDDQTLLSLNQNSFEISVIPEAAMASEAAGVFTSAEPGYVAGEIMKARVLFARDHPDVDARAFFWYMRDGVVVTFFNLDQSDDGRTLRIVERYIAQGADPWKVEKWTGTYDDLAEQMTFEHPY